MTSGHTPNWVFHQKTLHFRRRWRTFRVDQTNGVLDRPGVYVVYYGTRPYYVGSSTAVKTRLRQHRTTTFKTAFPDQDGIRIKVKYSTRFGEWLMLELRLIKRLRPDLNTSGIFISLDAHPVWAS